MSEQILFQSKGAPEFRFLSNFHLCIFSDEQGTYRSVEHYYQAAKCADETERFKILSAGTPADARRYGQKVKLIPNWNEETRETVMTNALLLKFQQNEDLMEMLLATDGFELVEYAPWGDTFWGVGKDLKGDNRLGKILMQIRDAEKARRTK